MFELCICRLRDADDANAKFFQQEKRCKTQKRKNKNIKSRIYFYNFWDKMQKRSAQKRAVHKTNKHNQKFF